MPKAVRNCDIEAIKLFEQSLDIPSVDRLSWLKQHTQHHPQLRTKLVSMFYLDHDDHTHLKTGQAHLPEDQNLDAPAQIGAYEVQELIGYGGMGAVYRGKRSIGDFEHDVAIKLIQKGTLSDQLSERFWHERQILAQFNHPNIARLFDGGTTEDGRPYIIMEYVNGIAITKWLARHPISLDQRLKIYLDICDAVSYAHQNLIVHRDLTPVNILVTEEGVVRLIDFGIARPANQEHHPDSSSDESHSYTPGYAAPERLNGGGTNTLSDIYSLGKLLKDIISSLPANAELKAIIKKAMATDVTKRYASVTALASDIRNFRNKKPVQAFNTSPFYELSKFISRQKGLVAISVVSMATILLALATTYSLYLQAKQERIAADSRYEDVRQLANFMMFDLYDELEKVPGNTKSIELLADHTQDYLNSLSSDKRASLEVKLEAAKGYRRLADIMGNPIMANLGKRSETGLLLDKARQELQQLATLYPNEPETFRSWGEVAFSQSVHKYVSDDDNRGAVELAQEAVNAYRALDNITQMTPDDKRNLARARMMTAVPLPFLGRAQEGVQILQQIREDVATLAHNYPDDKNIKSYYGSINTEVARAMTRLQNETGIENDPLPYWNKAIQIREETYQDHPEDIRPYRSLVTMYYERGAIYRSKENYNLALADIKRSDEIAQELLQLAPDDQWLQRIASGITDEMAKTLSYAGRHDEALLLADRALKKDRQEFLAHADNSGYHREWAFALVLHAEIQLAAGNKAYGCSLLKDAKTQWDEYDRLYGINEYDRNESLATMTQLLSQC
ncbi:MAG: protein kinase domain-containing protein [bacterium]